ncbi:MAG: hypothetical protein R2793_08650 [Flavobacteriaceae bacterium]
MRLFFFMLLLWVSPLTFAQNGNSTLFCQQLEKLNRIIANEHYSPKPLDDSLSVGVYQLFLEKLNDEHWFFLKEDMDLFEKDRLQLDDYLKEKNCLFIDKYVDRYSQRINQIAAFLDTLKTQELDYSGIDTLSFVDRPNERYFSNLATLKKSWKKKARFAILSKIIEEDSVYGEIEQNFTQLEAQLKEKVIQDLICQLEELLNQEGGIEEFVKKSFLNSIANYQDPNTNFFSASDKDYFDNSLSSSQFSFGIYTTKNKQGEIEVSYIAPGSIASKDGTIEESDIIKSLFSVSSQTNMDTFCVSNNEIAYFLNDSKNNTVRFRIKKKDGTIKEIQLTKELIKSPENLTRAYSNKNTEDVGYIYSFFLYRYGIPPMDWVLLMDVAKKYTSLKSKILKGLL